MTTDQHQNAAVISLTPQLLPVFAAVLSEPTEQLEDETRAKVIATVKFIAEKNPSAVQSNPALMKALQG